MIFDAHFHIIDSQFPLIENKGFTPDPFSVADYQHAIEHLPIRGGVVVAGSFQHGYQAFLIRALAELGEGYVGVTTIANPMTDQQIIDLDNQGIKAVRINLFRGEETLSQLVGLANRVYELVGWHVELYVANSALHTLLPVIKQMPKVCIDHLGLTSQGLEDLYHLIEHGVFVKATGFMRVDFDVLSVMKQIVSLNPNVLMFGTDLPGTRASRPFNQTDLSLIQAGFDSTISQKILHDNALNFYGIKSLPPV